MTRGSWSLALRTIRRAKLRSTLMGLGIALGVLAIVLTVATGEGARRAVQRSFKAMVGSLDVLFVQPGGRAQRGMATMESAVATLVPEDADALRSIPNVADVGMQQSAQNTPIEANGKSGTTFLFGTSPNWRAIRGDSVAAGRYFGADDDQALARVIVLGADVARDFFGGAAAVGQTMRVNGVEFEIIGVLAPNGAGPGGASMDNLAYIPIGTASRRVFNRNYLSLMSVKLRDATRATATQQAVERVLRERHAIAPTALPDFRVSSPAAMIARVANVDTTLRKALLWVGVLALVIGGAMIANLMFAAISSRRHEIAIRRAVGATRSDILRQFWFEAVLVALVAAVMGEVIGLAAIALGARMMGFSLAPSWSVSAAAIAGSIAIGLVAGFLPARRAATLHPSAALRDS